VKERESGPTWYGVCSIVWELCDSWVPFCMRFTPVTSVTTKANVAPGKFTPYLHKAQRQYPTAPRRNARFRVGIFRVLRTGAWTDAV
jgi:hypothetical protein